MRLNTGKAQLLKEETNEKELIHTEVMEEVCEKEKNVASNVNSMNIDIPSSSSEAKKMSEEIESDSMSNSKTLAEQLREITTKKIDELFANIKNKMFEDANMLNVDTIYCCSEQEMKLAQRIATLLEREDLKVSINTQDSNIKIEWM